MGAIFAMLFQKHLCVYFVLVPILKLKRHFRKNTKISFHLSVGSMPVLLGLSCAVLLLLTLVFVFIEFGEKSCCCGQYTFLTFFNLFIIAPVVAWTAMVVFPLGIPDEEPNQFSPYTMGWLRIGGIRYDNQYSKLKCDPVFWKGAFWFVCLFCAFEVGIIVAIFLKFCKVTCRCICICCCENEDRDRKQGQNYAFSSDARGATGTWQAPRQAITSKTPRVVRRAAAAAAQFYLANQGNTSVLPQVVPLDTARGWAGWALADPEFGTSGYAIQNRRDRLYSPHYRRSPSAVSTSTISTNASFQSY